MQLSEGLHTTQDARQLHAAGQLDPTHTQPPAPKRVLQALQYYCTLTTTSQQQQLQRRIKVIVEAHGLTISCEYLLHRTSHCAHCGTAVLNIQP